MAKFRDSTGRVVMRSTKQTVHRDALKVALTWEDSATKARAGELTQAASVKVLRELMEQTTGETLKTPCVWETLDGYLDACKATGGAASTQARYRPIFTRFLAHIGEVRARASIASVTVSEIEGWRNAELAAGVSGKSANLGLGVLRAAFNAAKRRGEILHNPCDAVANVAERSDEREPFTEADIAALLRTAKGTDWQGAVVVAVWTGLRLIDVAGLHADRYS
jgi:integrase